jgi:hypothetical protein
MVIMFRKPLFRNSVATSSVLPEFRLVSHVLLHLRNYSMSFNEIWYYGRTLVIADKLGLLGRCSD